MEGLSTTGAPLAALIISVATFLFTQKRAQREEEVRAQKDILALMKTRQDEQSQRIGELTSELAEVRTRLNSCEAAREDLARDNLRLMRTALGLEN